MIKLKPLISELTRDQKDRKKDYLFQQAKLTASNTFPTWSEVWKMFKNEGDNLSRAIECLSVAGETDEKTQLEMIEDEQREKYFDLVEEYKRLDGATCWRDITIPGNMNPTNIPQLGIYWAIERDAAEAHWGKFGHHQTTVTYEGIIDFHNVDWYGTMFARMNYDLGDMEKEIRFIKNSKIFVTTCDRYSSELDNDNDTGMKRLIINDWRRA